MRSILRSTHVLFLLAAVPIVVAAQDPPKPANRTSTDQEMIANALSAAPTSVAATATVTTLDGRVLRKGTSDYVCTPDMPDVPNNTPMCLDGPWRTVMDAMKNKRVPTITKMGFAYMLQGDLPVSNIDPFAKAPTPTNQWIEAGGPHVMVVLPDQKLLEGLSTDPKSGGPFVMWKGTPYAHIMVPAPRQPR